ncbi:MAG: hypothetical protein C4554_04665 [Dethiobacter sp.]|nr:MAG: hypothetical protein C4554_04665 [Dethiobacter sp.]
MGGGILLFGIVLCISLLVRLLISQFFSHKIFDEDMSMPLMRGLMTPGNDIPAEEYPSSSKNPAGIENEGG